MKRRILAVLTAATLGGTAVGTTSCYGTFALTKKVHSWNGSLD